MSYLDKYKNRLKRSGNDVGEVYSNNTISFIDKTFHASPTFRVLEVKSSEFPDILEIDARVVEIERMGSIREVLFRPLQGLNIGTYVKFDGDTWIVYDIYGSKESTKIKALVQKCNRTLKWEDENGIIKEIDCISSATPIGSKANQGKNDIEWNKFDVRLATGQLFVYVEKNSQTKDIKMNQRFIFGRNVYEVFGIDDITYVDKNGHGIIQMTIKITTINEKDDFDNRIAFNVYKTDEDNEEKGGRIW